MLTPTEEWASLNTDINEMKLEIVCKPHTHSYVCVHILFVGYTVDATILNFRILMF
jgi:hypothetical protein